jgi:acyl-CoA reductase-like NAD-dependent aldehyde dehydrogenase
MKIHASMQRSEKQIEAAFASAYQAQLAWSQKKISERTVCLQRLRVLLVDHRREIADAIQVPSRQGFRETITSELMPLADTAKWLHKSAARILAPRHLDGGGSPFWLGRLRSKVYRVPCGLVLIIGAFNYPLFLTGSQLLHALAAGNAVVVKPAPGAEKVTSILISLLEKAGVPAELMVLLDSSVESAQQAIKIGVNKVVLTGSSKSGRAVLQQLASTLTPSVMELGGCDAVYLLPGGDMHRVCDLLLFGTRLNGGATCMAPRRVFLPKRSSEVFHRLLAQRFEAVDQKEWSTWISDGTRLRLEQGIEDAISKGATIFSQGITKPTDLPGKSEAPPEGHTRCGHIVLTDITHSMRLCTTDLFAPLVLIIPVEDWSEALHADSKCPYALTASVFGPTEDALRLVKFISAGFVSINDIVVPTADPRLPFGGKGESGFGSTRGNEGLLEMTFAKVVSIRLGKWLPHARMPDPSDESLLDGLLQFNHHSGWRKRLGGLVQTVRAAMSQQKRVKDTQPSTEELR